MTPPAQPDFPTDQPSSPSHSQDPGHHHQDAITTETILQSDPETTPFVAAGGGTNRRERLGESCLTSESTFEEVAELVQRKYWAGHVPSVRQTYGNILKYSLLRTLGDLPIGALDENDLEELFSTWQDEDEVERSTIDGRISVLSSILKIAMAKGLMTTDPLPLARKTLRKAEKSEAQVFSVAEERTLLEAFARLKLVHHCLFLLLLRTGMRIGEALGLQIDDIDLARRIITIKRSWTCGAEGAPKYGSKRTVGISDDLYLILNQYIRQIRQEEMLNWLEPTVYLFPGISRKKPLNLMAIRKDVWKVLLAECGIPYRRLHDLRHTFATTVLRAGAELHLVSRWLGHKSLSTTYDTYCHLMPKDYLLITAFVGSPDTRQGGNGPCPTCRRPSRPNCAVRS